MDCFESLNICDASVEEVSMQRFWNMTGKLRMKLYEFKLDSTSFLFSGRRAIQAEGIP